MKQRTGVLVETLQAGQEEAFDELVRLYRKDLLRVTYRVLQDHGEAEDAVQEALLRAYRHIHTYDATYRFTTWLYRIATNVAIDRLRARKREYSLDADHDDMFGLTFLHRLPDAGLTPPDWLEQRERYDEIFTAMADLPEKYRVPLLLKCVDGLSLKEIGLRLDLSVGTVKTRIFRGRDLLKHAVDEERT